MCTESSVSAAELSSEEKYSGLLEEILEHNDSLLSVNPHDMLLGRIVTIDDSGIFVVFGNTQARAMSLCPVEKKDVGRVCAIQFIQGDLTKPVVMGFIQSTSYSTSSEIAQTDNIAVVRQGNRVVIKADDELVLQCGESCIVMTAEGTVYIRALYIDSHAQATHRLRGGSVQVN
ncbi:hypothetical protein CRI66_21985 [Escherichia sp. E4694]|uniref:DUF6484 domain-containing protein n=1 Tax=Escherichia sp. E4694 TaxID=2044464 RepID=UPI00107FD707|nr:DUF6484 domain-containing protein [Escherichia sp. E4694]TGB74231.1 hypothetical protein CRI66_21985 [Escherichia sp. E4694]